MNWAACADRSTRWPNPHSRSPPHWVPEYRASRAVARAPNARRACPRLAPIVLSPPNAHPARIAGQSRPCCPINRDDRSKGKPVTTPKGNADLWSTPSKVAGANDTAPCIIVAQSPPVSVSSAGSASWSCNGSAMIKWPLRLSAIRVTHLHQTVRAVRTGQFHRTDAVKRRAMIHLRGPADQFIRRRHRHQLLKQCVQKWL